MKKSESNFALIVAAAILFSCAVKEKPPGGPEDKTAPAILQIDPEPGGTGIAPNSKFVITFSKPMDKVSTQNAVFLSPVFWQYPTVQWKGKKLIITPPENLSPNKTYVLTVGADAQDYHKNKMGKSFSFAFSTGDKIDSCSIGGVIYSQDKSGMNFDIWAYTVNDTGSVNFLKEIPDFATQVDSMGHFSITYMNAARYLVIAVNDKNDDLFWDPSAEAIGLPPFLIPLADGESYKGLVLRPIRRDTLTAYISKAKAMDSRKLEVEFSQPISPERYFKPEFFKILATEDSTSLAIEGTYVGENGKFIMETAPQIDKEQYRLTPEGIVTDWGNRFDTTGIIFDGTEDIDTEGPKLIKAEPGRSSGIVYQDSVIDLTFSERIKVLGFSDAVSVVSDSLDTLKFTPEWIAPNKVRLRFPGSIPRQKKIGIIFKPARIFDIAGTAMKDSILELSFRLPPADTVGSVSASTEPNNKIIGDLTSLTRDGAVYEARATGAGQMSFESVLPGAFNLIWFEDTDGDGKWSIGSVDPFKPPERFSFMADSVSVRSRWATDVGEIKLPVPGR